MEFDKKDVTAGAFVVAAIIVFIGAMVAVERERYMAETYHLRIHLSEIAGIDRGVDVMYKGYKAGEVDRVKVVYEPEFRFVVRLAVKSEIRLRQGTVVAVRNKGLGGGKVLDLVPPEGTGGPILEEGAILPTTRETDLMAKANEVLGEAQKMVKSFQQKGTAEEAAAVVRAARIALEHLDQTLVSTHAMVEEDRVALRATLDQTRELTTRSNDLLEKKSAAMERSLKNLDDSMTHLPAILKNLEELTADLKKHPWHLIRKGKEDPVEVEHNH